jgi:S1-C subfamily serine protease
MNTDSMQDPGRRAGAMSVTMIALVMVALAWAHDTRAAQSAPPARELTVDALSVVKVQAQAVKDARSLNTLGSQREGTGVVVDSNGLVLTIGYLIVEAENVQLSTADGKVFPATVVGYDNRTGLGVVRSLTPLPVKPVDFGVSATAAERELVLIVGFDGVAPAYIVSKRPFVGYWEYLLDEAIYTAPATVNWQGAALLDRQGKLLGIGSLAVGDSMGAQTQVPGNMFLPIDLLKPVVGELVAKGRVDAKPRPWLGVNTQDVQGHLIVTRVSPDSPAEAAGLTRGDLIVGIAGQPVQGQADFYMRLWARGDAGVEVPLDVLKGAKIEQYTVKSMAREQYYRAKQVY